MEYLGTLFSPEIVLRLRGASATTETARYSPYFIGTSGRWNGATVFWQIDRRGHIRTGKIMLYDAITGNRVKKPYNRIDWIHKTPPQPDFNLRQCMFGEHLLKDNDKTVAIVESEKTAIIASVYLPEFTWLATGGLSHLNPEKCRALKDRNVVLFPDLGGYDKWKAKAAELSSLARFTISDLLERKATHWNRRDGLDIADYLVRLNVEDFNDL